MVLGGLQIAFSGPWEFPQMTNQNFGSILWKFPQARKTADVSIFVT